MLDALELARRLRVAMDNHKPKVTSAEVAKVCKVTPQAVHGWRKTGRIAKRYLVIISKVTEKPLNYFLDEVAQARQETPAYLTDDERELLEKYRAATPRWQMALQHLASLRADKQEEVSHGTMVLLAKAAAEPASDKRVEDAYGPAPKR